MPKAFVYGDNISTDDIIAGRYLSKHDPKWWASHVMENIDPEFSKKVRKGDVVVGGRNFGCGSSREQAPIALKEAGIAAVVAESFARIFYRNAINQGLPALVCPGIKQGFKTGDKISVDFVKGEIKNLSSGKIFMAQPLPGFILEILKAGGLVPYMKKRRRR